MGHAPYIMPDGRPLGQFLQETQEENKGRKKSQGTRRSRKFDKLEQWSHRAPQTALPEDEFDSSRLGRDRRRRYLNEKILRDMAGAMTAADMEALFKPVPFGSTGHESPLSQVTIPSDFPVWDLFRNIDEDRQNSTLQKWESAAKSNKRARQEESEGLQDSSALTALKQWASVPKKAREAMKRCTPEIVETLEMPIIEFVDKDVQENEANEALELQLNDGYQRLLTHGIAMYHQLHSRTDSSGRTFIQYSRQRQKEGSDPPSRHPQITCSDICFAISQESPGGLTAQGLNSYWRRMHYGTDGDSEASYVVI